MREAAGAISDRRARRWERRRRVGPLIVGAAGWLLGATLIAVGVLSGGVGGLFVSRASVSPAPSAADAAMTTFLMSAPPADAKMITMVFVASAVWLATVVVLSRVRGFVPRGGGTTT